MLRVRAQYDFQGVDEEEISFEAGEVVVVLEKDGGSGDGWWKGRNANNEVGFFPSTYVREIDDSDIIAPLTNDSGAAVDAPPTVDDVPDPGPPSSSLPMSRAASTTGEPAAAAVIERPSNVDDWLPDHVEHWLIENGWKEYSAVFGSMNGAQLLAANHDSLRERGLLVVGDRIKIVGLIKRLNGLDPEEDRLQPKEKEAADPVVVKDAEPVQAAAAEPEAPKVVAEIGSQSSSKPAPVLPSSPAPALPTLAAPPIPSQSSSAAAAPAPQQQQQQQQQQQPSQRPPSDQHLGFVVLVDHFARGPGELTLRVDDVVMFKSRIDDATYEGELRGQTGTFPAKNVRALKATEFPNGSMRLARAGLGQRQHSRSVYKPVEAAPPPVYGRDIVNPDIKGWLTKQGGSVKSWKRRWFILKNPCLYYFKDPMDSLALGVILLPSYTIAVAPEVKQPFGFKATHPGARAYYFYADSDKERELWIRAMRQVAMTSEPVEDQAARAQATKASGATTKLIEPVEAPAAAAPSISASQSNHLLLLQSIAAMEQQQRQGESPQSTPQQPRVAAPQAKLGIGSPMAPARSPAPHVPTTGIAALGPTGPASPTSSSSPSSSAESVVVAPAPAPAAAAAAAPIAAAVASPPLHVEAAHARSASSQLASPSAPAALLAAQSLGTMTSILSEAARPAAAAAPLASSSSSGGLDAASLAGAAAALRPAAAAAVPSGTAAAGSGSGDLSDQVAAKLGKLKSAASTVDVEAQNADTIRWLNGVRGSGDAAADPITLDNVVEIASNGLLLITVVESVTGGSVGKYNKTPKLPIHGQENFATALSCLEKQGFSVAKFPASDLQKGDKKRLLALFREIKLKYAPVA